MKTDIEIASEAKLKPITEIAAQLGIAEDNLECYGKYKAKVNGRGNKKGKLILVTAINPTPAGEGKTTISIGLADGLKKTGRNVCLALREPSLGPVFGIKGGAAGGGYAQIAPMEDINLHFTGDLHAITAANNLLAAMIDNHIHWGNELKIKEVTWHRCQDVNDRALRNIRSGVGFDCERDEHFDITAASEVMAVLCLSSDLDDLKKRLGNMVIGLDEDGNRVTAHQIKAEEAMTILLKDAIKPNLVQTLEGVPAFVHGGPFANIAHGCNSIQATRAALSYADYAVTEAGFGADLGAEKFLDIKCRTAGLEPDAVVIVATLRALKCAGGKTENLSTRDDECLVKGIDNLKKHVENITGVFKLPCVVAINRFATDEDAEIELLENELKALGVRAVCAECWAKGGAGAVKLADAVAELTSSKKTKMEFSYSLDQSTEDKIVIIAKKIYGADGVIFTDKAKADIAKYPQNLPVCIAKTQFSLTDNPKIIGRPSGFNITIKEVMYKAGAGFLVAIAGNIMLMPGLSRSPSAERMSINDGVIEGLF
ncbi:MAG: formate--tetrahydrofolate ligase [Clostridiales bacterium]|nr:formate--tetrahydrofolate ligase [Clostridiales bacterium]